MSCQTPGFLPFFLALSSLILYVCLPLRVQYNLHIQRLQHISKTILTRQQFRCGMRLDGSHPSRTIPRMKTQARGGPRRLFEAPRKDRFKKKRMDNGFCWLCQANMWQC